MIIYVKKVVAMLISAFFLVSLKLSNKEVIIRPIPITKSKKKI